MAGKSFMANGLADSEGGRFVNVGPAAELSLFQSCWRPDWTCSALRSSNTTTSLETSRLDPGGQVTVQP